MISDDATLPDTPDALKKIVISLHAKVERYDREIELLREHVRLLLAQLYGRKSEKIIPIDGPQPLYLFDMPEPEGLDEEPEEKIQVNGHTRKKRGRKPLPEHLPRVEVVHDVA